MIMCNSTCNNTGFQTQLQALSSPLCLLYPPSSSQTRIKKIRVALKSLSCHSDAFREHLRAPEATWTHISLPERWGEETGDLWAWRIICRLSLSVSSLPPLVRLAAALLAAWQAPKAGRQRMYSNLRGRKWHASASETGIKDVLSLYGNARWLLVKVTGLGVSGLRASLKSVNRAQITSSNQTEEIWWNTKGFIQLSTLWFHFYLNKVNKLSIDQWNNK